MICTYFAEQLLNDQMYWIEHSKTPSGITQEPTSYDVACSLVAWVLVNSKGDLSVHRPTILMMHIFPKVEELIHKEKEKQDKLIKKHNAVVDSYDKKIPNQR